MAKVLFAANALTGGVSGCLDDILHTALEDGNTAIVISSADGKTYFLVYDASEAGAESSPDIIIPDSNITGTGAWVLSAVAPAIDLSTLTASATEINTACDGILATAAEINTACDGILATAAEINSVCDGASSGSNSADNNFTNGTISWGKVGNIVVISWSILTHASGSNASSSSGFIPAGFRPSGTVYNVTYFTNTNVEQIEINSTGFFICVHRDKDGGAVSQTTLRAGSITYLVA